MHSIRYSFYFRVLAIIGLVGLDRSHKLQQKPLLLLLLHGQDSSSEYCLFSSYCRRLHPRTIQEYDSYHNTNSDNAIRHRNAISMKESYNIRF